jgi:DNA-binding response OmpR family regulator
MFNRTKSRGRAPKVVVCDDEPHICKLLSEHLNNIGYKVRVAKDGQECLNELARDMPDAMILDLKMPRMNGIEVIRKLRKLNSAMPILVLSGFHDLSREVEAKELSIGVFTTKPFHVSEVAKLLEKTLLDIKDATGSDFEVPHQADD